MRKSTGRSSAQPSSTPRFARAAFIACTLAGTLGARAQCVASFAAATFHPMGSPYTVVVGDFNHDGLKDLAAANFSLSSLTIRLASTTFPGSYNGAITIPLGSNPRGAAVADFNRDGIDDIAVVYVNGGAARYAIILGTSSPTGNFATPVTAPIPSQPFDLRVGDLNNDGKVDLVSVCGCGAISVLLGNGDGTFQTATNYFSGSVSAYEVAIGDLNGDGRLDIIVPSSAVPSGAAQVGVGLSTATSPLTFSSITNYPTGWFTGWGAATGDFNGDGRDDVVATTRLSTRVQVMLSAPDGSLTAQTAVGAGSQPQDVTVADFNQDGYLDAAVGNWGGATVSVHLGNGTGALGAARSFAVTTNPNSIRVADMNNDGLPDIITGDQASGNASILLNTSNIIPFSQQASARGVCGTGSAPFTVATATPATSFRWQIEDGPNSWITLSTTPTNLPRGGNAFLSAANVASTRVSVRQRVGIFRVRCIASNACANGISAAVNLRVGCDSIANIVTVGGEQTCDDELTADDVIAFLAGFFAQQPISDVARLGGGIGADGQWTADDVIAFLAAFFAGCPQG